VCLVQNLTITLFCFCFPVHFPLFLLSGFQFVEPVECATQRQGTIAIPPLHTSGSHNIGIMNITQGLHVSFDGCASSRGINISIVPYDLSNSAVRIVFNSSQCENSRAGFFRSADFLLPGAYNVSVVGDASHRNGGNLSEGIDLDYILDIACSEIQTPSDGVVSCGSSVVGNTVGGSSFIGQLSPERHYQLYVNESQTYTFSTCNGTYAAFDTFVHPPPF
jgi:hypothetical protein